MNIVVKKVCDEVNDVLKHCWNVDSNIKRSKLYASNDSILECIEFYAYCIAPRSVALQMETHKKKHGGYAWLASSRPDLATAVKDVPYTREAEINFVIKFTVRGLKEICHQRLCKKAEEPTRDFMKLLVEKILEIEPELKNELVPLCVFRGGICTEFNSCKKKPIAK